MWIKKIVAALATILVYGSGLFAQTPEEIVNKMSEQMKRADTEGVVMDMIIKMPVIGAITSHNLIRGDKMKSTATVKGKKAVIWSDGTTTWTYDEQAGEITVSPRKQSDDSKKVDSDLKAFDVCLVLHPVRMMARIPESRMEWAMARFRDPLSDAPKKLAIRIAKPWVKPMIIPGTMNIYQSALPMAARA